MPVYAVTIACRASTHDYGPLWQALRKAGAQPLMDTTWALDVNQTVAEVTSAILSLCAPGDQLFVVEMAPSASWSATALEPAARAWFERRMKSVPAGAPRVAPAPQVASEAGVAAAKGERPRCH